MSENYCVELYVDNIRSFKHHFVTKEDADKFAESHPAGKFSIVKVVKHY